MISLHNITKTYTSGGRRSAALSDVDLDIPRGEIFGIIGASGAGKSTLVRLINLLERPETGDLTVNNRRTAEVRGRELLRLRREIGMVFQHFNLLSSKTVAENVAFPLQLAGVRDRREIAVRVAEMLDRVGLSDHATKYPRQLSGGQKQRVGIARALACRPAILLCDEATSALDPETTRSVLALLSEINRDLGLTIVLITHEMDVVRQICHRVAVLDAGRIVETGPVADVFLRPQHPATLALVREAAREDIRISAAAPFGSAVYRLTFVGDNAQGSLLGRLSRELGIDFGILGGQIGTIRDTPFTQLTVALSGKAIAAAVVRLDAAGVGAELLSTSRSGVTRNLELAHVV